MEEGGNESVSQEVQNTSQEEQQQQGVGGQIVEQAGQKAAETR